MVPGLFLLYDFRKRKGDIMDGQLALARIEDHGDRLDVVNLNIAARGALSPDLYDAVGRACRMAVDPRITSVIIRSEGGFFCAGGNLNLLRDRAGLGLAERKSRVDDLHDMIRTIRACPVPVIAAVDGGAAGAGLSLALACDLIVAEDDAQFTASYVKAGLVPDGGLTASLSASVPRALATEMCLLGRPVSAERMYQLGVINAVVAKGKVADKVACMADALSRGPREARKTIKSLVDSAYDTGTRAQMDRERDGMAEAVGTSEAREGISAFLEKRGPQFR